MPWDLDELEDDDEFAEVDAGMQEHLRDMVSPDEAAKDHAEEYNSNEVPFSEADAQAPYTFPAPAAGVPTVFLNVEGVLFPRGGSWCGQAQLSELKRVVDATKAQIVLTCDDRSAAFVKRVAAALADAGVFGLIGQTQDLQTANPNASSEELRAGEIGVWLEEHEEVINDDDPWVVIDDCPLDTETEDGVTHTVQTDGSVGLTEADADAAIQKLAVAA